MMNDTATNNNGTSYFFKQIDEKHISQETSQMLWNPKMDLIALAFANGDLHLYRMSWQKVWSVTSPQQNVTISSMAWRPDGKVLAVSYTNGHLKLLAVEDAKKIFSFNCNDPIQWLYWLQENEELSKKHDTDSFYEDISGRQLPKPISYDMICHLFEKTNNKDFPDNLFIKETKNLTYLVCAHGTSIAIFVYGYFLLIDANLDLVPSFLNYKQLKACFLSDNTSLISTFGLTDDNLLVYSLLDAKLLHDNHLQIKLISTKFGMLFSMLTSIKNVIKEMEELWEDILVEMDQKFQLYALEKYSNNTANSQAASQHQQQLTSLINNKQQNGNGNGNPLISQVAAIAANSGNDLSLVNDFMMLYAFGSCSDHFKTFLLHELTEKGLKKLELSVENYYSNIQRLLNANFHQISLCMFYHLNELYGITKWFDKFKIFALTEQHVNDVLNNCASLILKSQELNYVIDQNMKEIKLFFKWLHASILHLSDDQAATDMIRFNEEMETSILNFIQNTFKDAQTINLEKVGQYLKAENLRQTTTVNQNEENNWQSFLKSKLTAKEAEYLYLNKKEKSLIGCFEDFKQSLNDCFKCQAINSQQPFTFIKQYNIHKFNNAKDANDMMLSYKCFNDSIMTGLLMAKTNNECYILKHQVNTDPEVKAFIINLASHTIDLSQISLQDVYIYNENSVTLLGSDNKTHSSTYLIQLNLQQTSSNDISNGLIEVSTNGSANTSNASQNANDDEQSKKEGKNLLMIKAEKLSATSIVKYLQKLKSSSFCVSSSRKVAALLSSSKHRVKIFELEAEDDENEEEDDLACNNDNESDAGLSTNENGAGSEINMTGVSCSQENKPTASIVASQLASPTFNKQISEDQASIASSIVSNSTANFTPSGNSMTQAMLNKFNRQQQQHQQHHQHQQQHLQHQSSLANVSTCSITTNVSTTNRTATPSVCSSTGATAGTSFTLENSLSSTHFNRAKRKKNFNDYDEEEDEDDNFIDDNISENQTINDSIDPHFQQHQQQQLQQQQSINMDSNVEINSHQQIDTHNGHEGASSS